MPSPTRDATHVYPRSTGAGLEYLTAAEKGQDLLSALVLAQAPADTTAGRIWIEDATAILAAVEPRAEAVAASEQRQDVVAAQEPKAETTTPVEQGADSLQHDGAWVEPWQETVTAGEQRTDRAGAAEPKAETVTPGESSTDAVQAHATLDETGKQETVSAGEAGTDKAGASEAKAESPSVTEARTSPFAAKEQWTETPTVTEVRTDKRNMVEARAETVTPTESRTDALGGGDTGLPVVQTFTLGAPTGLVVPISAFSATDGLAPTLYLLTESATPPSAGSGNWQPASYWAGTGYTFGSAGAKTLWAWAKDGAGTVSSVYTSRNVTVSAGATGVYGQGTYQDAGRIRLHSDGTDAVGYVLVCSFYDDGEGATSMDYSVSRNGAQVFGGSVAAAGIRLEADGTGGCVRVRYASSLAGPWTTNSSYTDPTPLTGGSTSGTVADFTWGAY